MNTVIKCLLAVPAILASHSLANLVPRTDGPTAPPCSVPFTPYLYAGCYTDTKSPRALSFSPVGQDRQSMTVEKCAAVCKGKTRKDSQLEAGNEAAEGACTFQCSGNKTQTCGGNNLISVYMDPTYPSSDSSDILTYTPQGCYTEGYNGRAVAFRQSQLSTKNLTTKACLSTCKSQNYPLAATEYGSECYCGVVLGNGTAFAPDTECSTRCAGDSADFCGGRSRLNLYVASDLMSTEPCSPFVLPPPTVRSSTTTTTTSSQSTTFATSDTATTTTIHSDQSSSSTMSSAAASSSTSPSSSADPTSSETSESSSETSSSEATQTTSSDFTTSDLSTSQTSTSSEMTSEPSTDESAPTSTLTSATTDSSTTDSTTSQSTTTTSSAESLTPTTTENTTPSTTCISTVTPTPTCEYGCGKWCSKPIPVFSDHAACKVAVAQCILQIADCFLTAGWPASLQCAKYQSWCQSIGTYCGNICSGGKCSKKDCISKNPPVGGPTTTTSSTVNVCPATSTSASSTSSTAPIPTVSSICLLPNGPSGSGYNNGKCVGGIQPPALTCNNIRREFAQFPLKLYTNKESSQCGGYTRNTVPQACKDACVSQYNSCVGTYATSCKGQSQYGDRDSYDSARSKCTNQYSDCLAINKGASVGNRCTSFGLGWS
ncbi:MAG: hypothetical protein Q9169_005710 [Polycauliona sp. 2 TL-2023]